MRKKLIIPIVLGLVLLIGVVWFLLTTNKTTPANFYNNLSQVELANTQEELVTGLKYRQSLCDTCAMLFEFETEQKLSFWMEDTYISLDIIFMDRDGKIITIYTNTVPLQRYPTYDSAGLGKYVLETNAGFSQKNNLAAGQVIDINKLKEKEKPN